MALAWGMIFCVSMDGALVWLKVSHAFMVGARFWFLRAYVLRVGVLVWLMASMSGTPVLCFMFGIGDGPRVRGPVRAGVVGELVRPNYNFPCTEGSAWPVSAHFFRLQTAGRSYLCGGDTDCRGGRRAGAVLFFYLPKLARHVAPLALLAAQRRREMELDLKVEPHRRERLVYLKIWWAFRGVVSTRAGWGMAAAQHQSVEPSCANRRAIRTVGCVTQKSTFIDYHICAVTAVHWNPSLTPPVLNKIIPDLMPIIK